MAAVLNQLNGKYPKLSGYTIKYSISPEEIVVGKELHLTGYPEASLNRLVAV